MTTERLSFSKMNDRMKPQKYPYTLESLQRWAKWRQRLQASGLPANSASLARQFEYLPYVYGVALKSSLSFPDTTGPSREPSLPSNANQDSTSLLGTPAAPEAFSKILTTTPPLTTPLSPSIAVILNGWMADGASGDTGRSGAGAEPDGDAVCHGAAAWLCTVGHGHVCS